MGYLFTSESVCAGHPDKICDQISDAIVDKALQLDGQARVAVETLVTTNQVVMAGEVTCKESIAYSQIANTVITELGYTHKEYGFSDKSPINVYIHEQSPDIATGVDIGGAGDQGLMFGYACTQTPECMPLPITMAHQLAKNLDGLKQQYPFLRPDGKTQVTIAYEGRKPVAVEKLVLATPHDPELATDDLRKILINELVNPVLEKYHFKIDTSEVVINGTGVWEIGGPAADTGVTGRKIIVDSYGGWARHGGGCFSGKDATKVDRSGAYAARWAAKNVIAAGLADECEIQIAYVIGKREPVSLWLNTFGSEKKSIRLIREFVKQLTSFEVSEIIERLDLCKPIFKHTAAYGHFGRDGYSWEQISEK